jgi:hypothetical protein
MMTADDRAQAAVTLRALLERISESPAQNVLEG